MDVFHAHVDVQWHRMFLWLSRLGILWSWMLARHAGAHDPSFLEVSNTGWFNSSNDNLEWLYPEDRPFAHSVAMFLKNEGAKFVVDIGSGSGALTAAVAAVAQCSMLGLDGAPRVPPGKRFAGGGDVSFRHMDLAQPFPNNLGQFDWGMSIAVAEHVPVILEHIFLSNILHLAPHRGLILVWGSRGMPGTGHVNCRDEEEVLRIFGTLGFRHDVNASASLRRHAVQPWNKLALVLRRPSWSRGANKLDGLRGGFTVAFRGGAVMRADPVAEDIHLRPFFNAERFPESSVDSKPLIWTRDGHTRQGVDYRGTWFDRETGERFEVGCYTVHGPNDKDLFLGIVVDSCMDLRYLARLVQTEHDRVCWPSGPSGDKGWEWFSKEKCCHGTVSLPDGSFFSCFGEEFSPEACCIEVHDYPVDTRG